MSVTRASPSRERADSRTNFLGTGAMEGGVRLDEEAELGIHPTSSTQSNNPYAGFGYAQQASSGVYGQQQQASYNMFPPIAQQQQQQQRTNPLGSQPVGGQMGGQQRRRGESNASLGVRKPSSSGSPQ
jgi:hypothetical protein